jgi:hypothetical protein
MAGYASEVKLFGKWSFEDVEVRVLLRRCCRRCCLATGCKPWPGRPAVPPRRRCSPRRLAPLLGGTGPAWRGRR